VSASYESRLDHIAAALPATVKAIEVRGANTVAAGARLTAPVRTGRLKGAIHTEVADDGEGMYVVAGDHEAWYGHFAEFGTVREAARPFLVPTLEAESPGIIADAERAVRQVCEG
jgi:HK97 gp10 family phage protein